MTRNCIINRHLILISRHFVLLLNPEPNARVGGCEKPFKLISLWHGQYFLFHLLFQRHPLLLLLHLPPRILIDNRNIPIPFRDVTPTVNEFNSNSTQLFNQRQRRTESRKRTFDTSLHECTDGLEMQKTGRHFAVVDAIHLIDSQFKCSSIHLVTAKVHSISELETFVINPSLTWRVEFLWVGFSATVWCGVGCWQWVSPARQTRKTLVNSNWSQGHKNYTI